MKFKIQGDDNEEIKGSEGLTINIMGRNAIKEYVDNHIRELISGLSGEVDLLNERILRLEEELTIIRRKKELDKFK